MEPRIHQAHLSGQDAPCRQPGTPRCRHRNRPGGSPRRCPSSFLFPSRHQSHTGPLCLPHPPGSPSLAGKDRWQHVSHGRPALSTLQHLHSCWDFRTIWSFTPLKYRYLKVPPFKHYLLISVTSHSKTCKTLHFGKITIFSTGYTGDDLVGLCPF